MEGKKDKSKSMHKTPDSKRYKPWPWGQTLEEHFDKFFSSISQIMYQIVLNTRLSIYQVFFKYFLKNPCFQLCHNVLMTWHTWLMPVQADIGTEQLRKVLNKLSSYFFFLRNHLKPTWDKMPGVNLGHIGLYLESVWFYV